MARDRLEWIDVARGLAALTVTWMHVVMNNPRFLTSDLAQSILHGSAVYAYLGVYAFYIVSGYVIPLALLRTDYRLALFGRFMVKRLLRLQPPYYASLLLACGFAWLATMVPTYAGQPFRPDPAVLALHLVYLPTVFGDEWINPVYWSLLVEVEYYVAIGLAMPLFSRLPGWPLAGVLSALCLVPFALPEFTHLPFHLPFFVIGIALCFTASGRMPKAAALVTIGFAVAMIWVQREPAFAIVAAATVPLFLVRLPAPRWLCWFGTISYSLYLVHYVVGWRGVRAFMRFAHNDAERLLAYGAAVALSIAVAAIFYWLFERPSLRWSAMIRLPRRAAD